MRSGGGKKLSGRVFGVVTFAHPSFELYMTNGARIEAIFQMPFSFT